MKHKKKSFFRRYRLVLLSVAIFSGALLYPTPVPAPIVATPAPKPVHVITSSDIDKDVLFTNTNLERTNLGLQPLVLNESLNSSALDKCNHMVLNDYWSHIAPDGTTPWYFIRNHTRYHHASENLGNNFNSASELVNSWMLSPSHRSAIVNVNYTQVGYAVCKSENYISRGPQLVIVQHFVGY